METVGHTLPFVKANALIYLLANSLAELEVKTISVKVNDECTNELVDRMLYSLLDVRIKTLSVKLSAAKAKAQIDSVTYRQPAAVAEKLVDTWAI